MVCAVRRTEPASVNFEHDSDGIAGHPAVGLKSASGKSPNCIVATPEKGFGRAVLQRTRAVPKAGPRPLTGRGAYATGTSTCVTNTSLWRRREISASSATSKKRVNASTRLVRASSTDKP
jgi:hypothetical protein